MKTTVEEIKKIISKTIDKSQNLMYNKYVRLREEKPVWWNGRHSRLKICGLKRVGSNPTIGTS